MIKTIIPIDHQQSQMLILLNKILMAHFLLNH